MMLRGGGLYGSRSSSLAAALSMPFQARAEGDVILLPVMPGMQEMKRIITQRECNDSTKEQLHDERECRMSQTPELWRFDRACDP
jgi:hypothetical protein